MSERNYKYNGYQHYLNFIEKYSGAMNAASGSEVDANANVERKNIATLESEIYKKEAIAINRLAMQQEIEKLYGRELADKYIEDLESHLIYRHDETAIIGRPYCASITMYPYLIHGLEELGGSSTAPKNLQSFNGSFINLVFAVAAQLAGAVATPEYLPYLDHFIRKEYGDDYYLHADDIVDMSNAKRTIEDVITDGFQQVVYSINQPAAARGNQAVFWNIAYFDRYYFEGMFEDFVFPDGDTMKWESVNWLQKKFMKWFNNERLKKILTFPVETVNLLDDGTDYIDTEWRDFAAEMWSEGHSFFLYRSDSVDSLSSCCFSKDTPILWKSSTLGVQRTSLEELYNLKWEPYKKNLRIFHNGFWVKGKPIKLENRKMYRIRTSNHKEIIATDNHIHPTLNGEKITAQLSKEDYLAFNTTALEATSDNNENLSYEQGFIIGLFIGDGSFGSEIKGTIYDTNFSLNEQKYDIAKPFMEKALEQIDPECSIRLNKIYNHVLPVHISSKILVSFIQKWTNWERGTVAVNKQLNLNCLLQNKEFRQGILDGWYMTDGGNSNRCYTVSENLAKDMETLITSLGMSSIIDIEDRTDEPVIIREKYYKRNYPLYCVRWYEKCNKQTMDEVYRWKNNTQYFKITSIEEIPYNDPVYCIERNDANDPYFTLPNGLITHNCRLRNEIQDNQFSYTLGAGGISTGSKCVMTINFNRLIQTKHEDISAEDALAELVKRVHKYLKAFNSIVIKRYNDNMLPLYSAGFVSPDRQYLTVGINGLVESAEYLGFNINTDDDNYRHYVNTMLGIIKKLNREDAEKGIMFNTEYVPAENLGVKNAKWDKAEDITSNRDCYNSYFYIVDDVNTSVLDKFILHGKNFTENLDGGSALHMNLEEHLTKKQYLMLMETAIKTGCPYFTFNIPNTLCNDCKFISKHKLTKCPVCGSENLDYATRVIGYLKLVSAFSEQRQKEEKKRFYATEV